MALFDLLLVLCLATFARSQTPCQTCLTNFEQQEETNRQQREAAEQPLIQACYTKAGCTMPSHTTPTPDPAFAAAKTCVETAKTAVEGCVQANFSSFKMPVEGREGCFHRHHKGGEGRKEGEFKKEGTGMHENSRFTKECSNGGNATVLESCLKELHNGTHHGGQQNHNGKPNFVSNCSASLNVSCSAEFEGIRQALCTCKKQNREKFVSCFNHTNFNYSGQDWGKWKHDGGEHEKNFCEEDGREHGFGKERRPDQGSRFHPGKDDLEKATAEHFQRIRGGQQQERGHGGNQEGQNGTHQIFGNHNGHRRGN